MRMAQITVDINQFKAVEHIITILFWMHPRSVRWMTRLETEVMDFGKDSMQ